VLHALPCPSHPHWLDHSNYTWWRVQVMKLLNELNNTNMLKYNWQTWQGCQLLGHMNGPHVRQWTGTGWVRQSSTRVYTSWGMSCDYCEIGAKHTRKCIDSF
jgi:hypothetical protein